MNASFNLVDEKWIPCLRPDGTVSFNGLFDTLANASGYKEIRDPSPLVTISLHRLLLAILHRLFGPATPSAWAALWQDGEGRFDAKRLADYLKSSKIHSRFDLFDAAHPFYQTAALPLGPIDKKNMGRPKFVKPIWQLAHELAYSDSMNLFAHFKPSDWETRPPAEAARWLVAFQGFALGGLITTEEGRKAQDGSADAGQLVKSAMVLVKGKSLFQTLMLNLVHYSEDDEEPFTFEASRDQAAWERNSPTRAVDRSFDGYIDLLTWQSRRVKLVPAWADDGSLLGVSGVVAMKGYQLPGFSRRGCETMAGFVRAERAPRGQDPWPPLGFRSGKQLWRDSHALMQSEAENSERPAVLQWVDDLRGDGHLKRDEIELAVHGLSSDRAKIFFWRHEELPLPLDYLRDRELFGQLRHCISLAEEVGSALRQNVWIAVVNRLAGSIDMKPDTDRVRNVVEALGAERLYWSRLELPFRRVLVGLAAANSDRDQVVREWFVDVLCDMALSAFDSTIGRVDSGRDLKAATIGRGLLERNLAKIRKEHHIPDPDKKEGAA